MTMESGGLEPYAPRKPTPRLVRRSPVSWVTLDLVTETAEASATADSEPEIYRIRRDQALQASLNSLAVLYTDDFGGLLDQASVSGLSAYMRPFAWALAPTLAAEPSGKLVATWEREGSSLSIRFLNEHDFYYAMILTDRDRGQESRPWGKSRRESFFARHPLARTLMGMGRAA